MRRVLVAGVGNVLLGDDGWGVAVANRLAREELPAGVRVADFGIRGLHLAFELLDEPDLLVLVDAMARGGAPGTLYLVNHEVASEVEAPPAPDAHGMHPAAVLSALEAMGGTLPPSWIVGCEPGPCEGLALSDAAEQAIDPAIAIIRRLVTSGGTP